MKDEKFAAASLEVLEPKAWITSSFLAGFNFFRPREQIRFHGKQDGRLAPAYFSPDYKHCNQLLQTVKNRTTISILVFKEFLQTSI